MLGTAIPTGLPKVAVLETRHHSQGSGVPQPWAVRCNLFGVVRPAGVLVALRVDQNKRAGGDAPALYREAIQGARGNSE